MCSRGKAILGRQVFFIARLLTEGPGVCVHRLAVSIDPISHLRQRTDIGIGRVVEQLALAVIARHSDAHARSKRTVSPN